MAAVGLFGVLALRLWLLRARLGGGQRRFSVLVLLRLALLRLALAMAFGAWRPFAMVPSALASLAMASLTMAALTMAAFTLRRPAFARLAGRGFAHPGNWLAGQSLDRGH